MDIKDEDEVTKEQRIKDIKVTYSRKCYNEWIREQKHVAINKLPNEFRSKAYAETPEYDHYL